MTFSDNLLIQSRLHSSMKPQDLIKLCYQAAFGAEHLIQDKQRAREYLYQELESIDTSIYQDVPLYEQISDDIARVNIVAWKKKSLPINWLFEMFCYKNDQNEGSKDKFMAYLEETKKLVAEKTFSFSSLDFNAYFDEYLKSGICAVHHSEEYRKAEKPAYRIVDTKLLRLLPILEHINSYLLESNTCVISIDGRCGSGKSTMAKQLSAILGCDIIHMDDFFLPLQKRTEERLLEAGGNVDYERFSEEILPHLNESLGLSYRVFDCRIMDFNGSVDIKSSKIKLIEGSYSHHPYFNEYADIKVFSSISSEEQMRRIIKRNGEEVASIFKSKWIPMEEKYFASFEVKDKSDIIV